MFFISYLPDKLSNFVISVVIYTTIQYNPVFQKQCKQKSNLNVIFTMIFSLRAYYAKTNNEVTSANTAYVLFKATNLF